MRLIAIAIALFLCISISAQEKVLNDLVSKSLKEKAIDWNLSEEDIQSFIITDEYTTKHNGVHHVYVTQAYEGIPIHNAITSFNYDKNGTLFHSANRFIGDLSSKIESSSSGVTPEEALTIFAKTKNYELGKIQSLNAKKKNTIATLKTSFSKNEIPVKLLYVQSKNGMFRKSWDFEIIPIKGTDIWSARIDIETGKIIDESNLTVYCNVKNGAFHNHTSECRKSKNQKSSTFTFGENVMDGAQYRVYPVPAESPLHGEHELIESQASPVASPFGWHDTDGSAGPEYFITRGNNVHAFEDRNDNNRSSANEPNGGANLKFDFVHKTDAEPIDSEKADIVNLFYMNNFVHDFTYNYGFDEVAGNFQANNYGNGGRDNDYVSAQGLDGSGTNNANFGTPSDGESGTMQMFEWTISESADRVRITEPAELSGIVATGGADFGGDIPLDEALSGEIVLIEDDLFPFSDGCENILNGDELAGKVALIDRGICQFGTKALQAQNAGAIAAIICNFEEATIGMAGGTDGGNVTIPVVSFASSSCDVIKTSINSGVPVLIDFQLQNVEGDRPSAYSSSFDNGVIAHEYGHGISNRLTGGPSAAGCLGNDEQMGEGWSDFFALITSHEDGDENTDNRGIGTYVNGERSTGGGIRTFPYSTNMNVSRYTYNTIRGTTAPHPLGSVWTACLWDMYWAFVDLYGFDRDITNLDSGNSKAILLVMDGMKMQPCSPGFIEGRDAILAADIANNNGENQCLIWELFARRGVGYDAIGGSSNNRNDNEEGFEPLPTCIEKLKIKKDLNNYVEAGDSVNVTLTVTNHKKTDLNNVKVEDRFPFGMIVDPNNDGGGRIYGNTIVFEVGKMESLEEQTLNYTIIADPNRTSKSKFFDDMDDGISTLIEFPINFDNDFFWTLENKDSYSGLFAWFIRSKASELDQGLITTEPFLVTNEKSTFKFWHKFETSAGVDGGFLEISNDDTETWKIVTKDKFIRNAYNSTISYGTIAIPNLGGFSGNSNGFIDSYVDVSNFIGEEIYIRFRFATDTDSSDDNVNNGWYVDDVEYLNLETYSQTEACVTASEGDEACDDEEVIVINSIPGVFTPTDEIEEKSIGMTIAPNPVSDILNVSFELDGAAKGQILLIDVTGKVVLRKSIDAFIGMNTYQINVAEYSSGIYFLETIMNGTLESQKVIIE